MMKRSDLGSTMDFLFSIFRMRFNYRTFRFSESGNLGFWNYKFFEATNPTYRDFPLEWKSTETSPCNAILGGIFSSITLF
ncbi:hypothetical protein ACS0PU_005578 [Formica fusca]